MPPPAELKIYHIIHVDRLASTIADGCLSARLLDAYFIAIE